MLNNFKVKFITNINRIKNVIKLGCIYIILYERNRHKQNF